MPCKVCSQPSPIVQDCMSSPRDDRRLLTYWRGLQKKMGGEDAFFGAVEDLCETPAWNTRE